MKDVSSEYLIDLIKNIGALKSMIKILENECTMIWGEEYNDILVPIKEALIEKEKMLKHIMQMEV